MRAILPMHRPVAAAAAVAAAVLAAACSTPASGTVVAGGGSGGRILVVAAENFWGSIARQLGGSRVTEISIITNPNTDPHAYEPAVGDARAIASAQLAIVNGIGYDPWAPELLATGAAQRRRTLTVGDLLGLKPGDNPHQWYSAARVHQVIGAITADYKRIDPAGAAYFDSQRNTFETRTLARYSQLIAQIRARYAGTPIGASESVVSPLADTLGLRVLTPVSVLKAVSEGSEPTAQGKATADAQIARKQIKVYLYNSQNATPDVTAQVKEAQAARIPVATVTETLAPATVTFQQWQVTELQGIAGALHRATGK